MPVEASAGPRLRVPPYRVASMLPAFKAAAILRDVPVATGDGSAERVSWPVTPACWSAWINVAMRENAATRNNTGREWSATCTLLPNSSAPYWRRPCFESTEKAGTGMNRQRRNATHTGRTRIVVGRTFRVECGADSGMSGLLRRFMLAQETVDSDDMVAAAGTGNLPAAQFQTWPLLAIFRLEPFGETCRTNIVEQLGWRSARR